MALPGLIILLVPICGPVNCLPSGGPCYSPRAVQIVEEYRRHADECEALARKAPTEEQREQIRKIAETWRKLAADRERWLGSQKHVPKKS